MNGSQSVIVQNKRIRYDFAIHRNITIICGDSATGKTTLVEMIQEYYDNGDSSGIALECPKTCVTLSGRNWQAELALYNDSLVFIDEGNAFVTSEAFSKAIQGTDNYYIIVNRENLENLPYSVKEIYGIRTSGKYGGLKQTYNELFEIYGQPLGKNDTLPATVLVEDSNAGYQFFSEVCNEQHLACTSAGGKSNIFECLTQSEAPAAALIIADGAAFGSQMGRIAKLIENGAPISLYLPESFEWLLLAADLLKDNEIRQALADPAEAIESADYFSWERFFTKLLTDKTAGTIWQYNKKKLNPIYLHDRERQTILALTPFARHS